MPNQVSTSVTPTPQAKPPHTSRAALEAFVEAVELFANYSGGPEPTVAYEDTDITLSQACKLVATCQASVPRSCAETLRYCDVELKALTYAAAAHALLARIRQLKRA
jgi:hypothetical protein